MRTYRKTKRHRNRKTRKRGGENNWWKNIETRNREPISNVIPLPKQIKLIGEPYVPTQLSNARESYRSKHINQNLIENAATRPFYQNHDANAAMLAAKASAIVSARAAKAAAKVEAAKAQASAKVEAAKAQAANLGRATLNQFTRERKERQSTRLANPIQKSQIQQNRNIAKWASNFRAYEPNSVYL
jgi:hypothetical protein